MVKRLEVLAIIPARGGSKGIPHKNIRDFSGYPLIAYSIAAGLQSRLVTRVILSTDDPEIAEVGRNFGADVPFLRPPALAQDNTLDLPVFQHALAWLTSNEAYGPDIVVQLRPTSPVRPVGLVDQAVQTLIDHPEVDSVRGIVPSGQNPHKMWRVDPQTGYMKNLIDVAGIAEPYNAPRQVLPPVYWQTGHIDAIRSTTILEQGSMSGRVIFPVMVDPRYTVDIDNPGDWINAERLVRESGLEMVTPGQARRPLPEQVKLVVFDFDGVMTDNRAWVDDQAHEYVAVYRSDSLGLARLMHTGVKVVVISAETNKVVQARCEKIGLPYIQGVADKTGVLKNYLREQQIDPQEAIYLGNDINDVPCFPLVGCGVVVADAQPEARRAADVVLSRPGGHGAVRELCDLLVERQAG